MNYIEIDPNIRCDGDNTFTLVEPELYDYLEVGCAYVVGESESGMTFPATLVRKENEGIVVFDVAWEKVKFNV